MSQYKGKSIKVAATGNFRNLLQIVAIFLVYIQ